MSNAQLMLHKGAFSSTYQDIQKVNTPSPTKHWQPLSHIKLIDTVKEESERAGLELKREEYGLTKDGARLFGVMEFLTEDPEMGFAIGIRNSHNKEWAAGICSGIRVFVCDNLAFSGNYTCKRKHTPSNMAEFIPDVKRALLEMPIKMDKLLEHVNGLKKEMITQEDAKLLIWDSCFEHQAISSLQISPIWLEYLHPTYEEFEPGSKYSLLMAYTEIFKGQKQIGALEKAYRLTAPVFGLDQF